MNHEAVLDYAAGLLVALINGELPFTCDLIEPPRVGSLFIYVGDTKIEFGYSTDELRYLNSVELNEVKYSNFDLPEPFVWDVFSWMRYTGHPISEDLVEWAIFWR